MGVLRIFKTGVFITFTNDTLKRRRSVPSCFVCNLVEYSYYDNKCVKCLNMIVW